MTLSKRHGTEIAGLEKRLININASHLWESVLSCQVQRFEGDRQVPWSEMDRSECFWIAEPRVAVLLGRNL